MTPTVGALTALAVGADDLWITTTYEYDAYGHRTATADPLGRVTRTGYDPRVHFYPVSTTKPAGLDNADRSGMRHWALRRLLRRANRFRNKPTPY